MKKIDSLVDRYTNENSQNKSHGEGFDAGMAGKPYKNPYEKKDKRDWVAYEEGYHKGKEYKKGM